MYVIIKVDGVYQPAKQEVDKSYGTLEEAQEVSDWLNLYVFNDERVESAIGAAPTAASLAGAAATKKHRDDGNDKIVKSLRRPK
jgi:hypothetical protein